LLRQLLDVRRDGITPGSPAEARLRRRIVEWGFEPPCTQFEVRDADDRFVARIDLAWPSRRVGLEYDSRRHHAPGRFAQHESRYAAIAALGWNVRAVELGDILPGETLLRDWLRAHLRAEGVALSGV
jgi:hypothetical protein